jgi:hypothetical protein
MTERRTAMHVKWLVAIMSALTALTLTVAGVPRAPVADAPPACTLEWAVLNGCPTSDYAAVAAHTVPVSPLLVKVPEL